MVLIWLRALSPFTPAKGKNQAITKLEIINYFKMEKILKFLWQHIILWSWKEKKIGWLLPLDSNVQVKSHMPLLRGKSGPGSS